MSFLESLVGRNMGTVSTIRPRQASLFEPVRPGIASVRAPETPAVAAGRNEAEANAQSETEIEIAPAPRPESPPNESDRHLQPKRRRPHRISVSHEVFDADASEIPPVNQDERLPASPRQRPPGTSADAKNPVTNREVSSPDTDAPDSERHEVRREPDAPLPDPRAMRERSGLLNAAPVDSKRENADSPTEEHEFRPRLSGGTLSFSEGGRKLPADVRPAVGQLVGPVLPPCNDISGDARGLRADEHRDSALSFRQSQPQQEPVIEVTIGRIEIRAETTGASNRKTERPASPVMGLDEYLRRRSNRGNA